jgi:hypothetical protein
MISNTLTLKDLHRMPIGEIAALPADQLVLLQEEADEALRAAKATRDWLEGAIAQRYADRARSLRRDAGKDTGTIRFNDGPVTVVADLPKKVDWDQAQLAALAERIRAEGDDPSEYVDIAFKVPERKYNAWPSHIQNAFQEARTVRTGKETFKLILGEGDR